MLKRGNKFYEELVKRNGHEDPLRKTLVIIDEAHKLYSNMTSAAEKPDMHTLETWVANSYKVSGEQSVRILAMTGTPYLDDGMDMIKLLNLLRPTNSQFPISFDAFSAKYLDANTGKFTADGKTVFLDDIAGYVSYLNRTRDGRNFAHPVFHPVYVNLSPYQHPKKASRELDKKIKDLKSVAKKLKKEISVKVKEENIKLKTERSKCIVDRKASEREKIQVKKSSLRDAKQAAKEHKVDATAKCAELPKGQRKSCKEDVQKAYNEEIERIKSELADITKGVKVDFSECDVIMEKLNVIKDELDESSGYKNIEKELTDLKLQMSNWYSEAKALKVVITDSVKLLKEHKFEFKKTKELYKQEQKTLARMKLSREEKKSLTRQLRMKFGPEIKSIKTRLHTLKMELAKLKQKKMLILLKMKRKRPEDVSPFSAIYKCLKPEFIHVNTPASMSYKNNAHNNSSIIRETLKNELANYYKARVDAIFDKEKVTKGDIALVFHPDKLPANLKKFYKEDFSVRRKIDRTFSEVMRLFAEGKLTKERAERIVS
jgi:hypothetical protein